MVKITEFEKIMRISRDRGVNIDPIKKSDDTQNGNRALRNLKDSQDKQKDLGYPEVRSAKATAYDSEEE